MKKHPPPVTIKPVSTASKQKGHKECPFCESSIMKDAVFCPNCGRKQEGRTLGTIPITSPPQATICSFCGRKLKPETKYCPDCGVKVEQ